MNSWLIEAVLMSTYRPCLEQKNWKYIKDYQAKNDKLVFLKQWKHWFYILIVTIFSFSSVDLSHTITHLIPYWTGPWLYIPHILFVFLFFIFSDSYLLITLKFVQHFFFLYLNFFFFYFTFFFNIALSMSLQCFWNTEL